MVGKKTKTKNKSASDFEEREMEMRGFEKEKYSSMGLDWLSKKKNASDFWRKGNWNDVIGTLIILMFCGSLVCCAFSFLFFLQFSIFFRVEDFSPLSTEIDFIINKRKFLKKKK